VIRVALPYHLRNLARVTGEVELDVAGAATLAAVLDALEAPLPDAVASGAEPLRIVGAMAGG